MQAWNSTFEESLQKGLLERGLAGFAGIVTLLNFYLILIGFLFV